MQNNSVSRPNAVTLYDTTDRSFVQKNLPVFANISRNAAAVPKLTLKDKAGLVFEVAVLLTLQLMEKLKVIR